MKERIISILFAGTLVYIVVSLVVIAGPGSLTRTKVSRIYRTYLLPGPFFNQERIIDTYSLALSWKVRDQWSDAIYPARDLFHRYNETFSPVNNYRSRFERSLYQDLLVRPLPTEQELESRKGFEHLTHYLKDRYVPPEADSIRLMIIRKQVMHYKVTRDTLYNMIRP